MRVPALVVAVSCAVPAPVAGQTVVGTVMDPLGGRPVVGAMVRLVRPDDEPTGVLFLTGSDGRFVLRAPGPGTYALTVERIGFAPTRTETVTVEDAATLRLDVRVQSRPVRLEGLEVRGQGRRCDVGRGDGGATQALWEEARKALAAATWTERRVGLSFRVSASQRVEEPRTGAVRDEQRQVRTLTGGNSVRTLPPEELARDGYVQDVEGSRYFYGPDAETLLSDVFLDTHCFEAVPGEGDDRDRVGLRFEPVEGRDVPDIEGSLWMDRRTNRLDRVEFRYTDAFEGPGESLAGGVVRFAELQDGRWFVRSWSIRAPLFAVQRGFARATGTFERRMVSAVSVQGADVLTVRGPGIDWRADRPVGRVIGTVWDSARAAPLENADVRLAGRGWTDLSDAEGRFELVDVTPGTYRIGFLHARLDSLDLEPWWTEIAVVEGQSTDVLLAVPGRERLLSLRCGDGGGAVVTGEVRDAAGVGVPGATVSASVGTGAPPMPATTDGEGRFALCGVEVGASLTVTALVGVLRSDAVPVAWDAAGAGRAVVLLVPRGAGPSAGTTGPVLVATVVSFDDRRPLEGTVVSLVDGAGRVRASAVSDPTGRVVLVPDAPGDYALSAERLGYEAVDGEPLELRGGIRQVEVRLSTRAIPLDEVLVEVRGRVAALERNGFYRRELTGLGRMLDRAAIERLNPVKTGDVMQRQRGVHIAATSTGNALRRFFVFTRATHVFDTCLPAVFLDGQLVRSGGRFRVQGEDRLSLDEIVAVHDVEAMELYVSAASIPFEFQGPGSGCGVVVVWTRLGPG